MQQPPHVTAHPLQSAPTIAHTASSGPSLLTYHLSAAQTFYLRLKAVVHSDPDLKQLLQWVLNYPGLAQGALEHIAFENALANFIDKHYATPDKRTDFYRKLCYVTGFSPTIEVNLPIFKRTEQQIGLKFFRLFMELIQRYQAHALKVTLSL